MSGWPAGEAYAVRPMRGRDVEWPSCSTQCVHHIWLTADHSDAAPPSRFSRAIKSARTFFPDRAHVEWRDSDAEVLVSRWKKTHFFFHTLATPVERADFLRMLIMHDFGGVYLDVDMELFACLPIDTTKAVNLVASPLFSEHFQSCLLVANRKLHPLWRDVALRIEDNFTGLQTRPGARVVRRLIENRLTRWATRLALTVFMTGPGNLDRCIASQLGAGYASEIGVLPSSCYSGPIAVHHEAGSWTPFPLLQAGATALDTLRRVCMKPAAYFALLVLVVKCALYCIHWS